MKILEEPTTFSCGLPPPNVTYQGLLFLEDLKSTSQYNHTPNKKNHKKGQFHITPYVLVTPMLGTHASPDWHIIPGATIHAGVRLQASVATLAAVSFNLTQQSSE